MSQTYKKLVGVLLCLALLFQVASPAVAAVLPAVALSFHIFLSSENYYVKIISFSLICSRK